MFSDGEGRIRSAQELDQPLVDDIQNLYIGQIKAGGRIWTDADKLTAIFQGEVLIYGHAEGDIFIIDRVRRVAIYGWATDQKADPRIGVLSLVGPSTEPKINRGSSEGAIEELLLQLHYAALSSDLPPLYESDDAVFPQVEQALARLTWKQEGQAYDQAVQMELTFEIVKLVDTKLGIVQALSLDRITVSFNRAGTGAPRPRPHFSLQSNCLTPKTPCGEGTQTRILPIKFVSFSEAHTLAEIEAICRTQIDGVCEVWRNKAALDLSVEATIQEGTIDQKADFSSLDATQERSLDSTGFASGDRVEVYVVDKLANRLGGGIAYNCGWAGAFCILDLEVASQNGFLLAHELGHVLGLDHPGASTCYPGSPDSIMQPTGTGGPIVVPNPNINTRFNCRIFTAVPSSTCPLTLNPIVTTTTTPDCFRLDA